MSCTGMPSVMQQTVLMAPSSDSKMASAAKGGGTKMTLAFAPAPGAAYCRQRVSPLPPSVPRQLDGLAGGVEHRLLGHDVLGGVLGKYLASLLGVGPVEPHNYGEVYPSALYGREEPAGHLVAPRDAAEDVEE